MKITILDQMTWTALFGLFVVGILMFNEVLIMFGSLGLLQFALAEKVIEALKVDDDGGG